MFCDMKWRIFGILFVLLILGSVTRDVSACTCPEVTAPPPCAMFWRSNFVLTARVTKIDRSSFGHPPVQNKLMVHLLVQRVYTGQVGRNVIVEQGEGIDCREILKQGAHYLIFASAYDKTRRELTIAPCAGPTEVKHATEDLHYIYRVKRGVATQSLSGTILRSRNQPLAGIHILVTSMGRKYSTTSDEKGAFRISNVRPGRYKVTIMGQFLSARFSYGNARYAQAKMGGISYDVELARGQCDYREVFVAPDS